MSFVTSDEKGRMLQDTVSSEVLESSAYKNTYSVTAMTLNSNS